MTTEVIMPKLGLTMTEGTVARWLKEAGQPVTKGEALLEVETDKVTLEVEALASGTLLKTLVGEGQTVPVAQIIGYIGEPGEEVPDASTPQSAPRQAGENPPTTAPLPSSADDKTPRVRISPMAAKLARENGIDPGSIHGTGPQGRIVREDIEAAISARLQRAQPAPSPSGVEPTGQPEPAAVAFALQPTTSIKRITAERMVESFRVPHFYLDVEVHAARLAEMREQLLPEAEHLYGVRLSYTDFLLRALALQLPGHPLLNAAWEQDQVRTFKEVHLGVATASPKGLVVPVIHRADSLSLVQLARARQGLSLKAKEGRLAYDDMQGGTFTLTNLGMFGVDSFAPILNPPQSGILAAGAVIERPIGENRKVVLRPTLRLTLAVDHRVVDGADAAVFLRDLRQLLEAPERMLLA